MATITICRNLHPRGWSLRRRRETVRPLSRARRHDAGNPIQHLSAGRRDISRQSDDRRRRRKDSRNAPRSRRAAATSASVMRHHAATRAFGAACTAARDERRLPAFPIAGVPASISSTPAACKSGGDGGFRARGKRYAGSLLRHREAWCRLCRNAATYAARSALLWVTIRAMQGGWY